MVTTKKKTEIIIEVLHVFEGEYPDVPIAPGIDFEALIEKDVEAGIKPFFMTLPLAHKGQVSRNQRRYSEREVDAIYSAIVLNKINGNRGHLKDEQRPYTFETPILHWVGAVIDSEGILWGKAYVPHTEPQVREYLRLQMAKNAAAGTSLYGLAYEEFDEEAGLYDVRDLEVEDIDLVHPSRVGVLLAGSMPPKITSEEKQDVQEADADELSVGDFVMWEKDGAAVRGQINQVWTEGEVEVPNNDDLPALNASEDDPVARMDIFYPSYDGHGFSRSHDQTVMYFSSLSKIEPLPETVSKSRTESVADDEDAATDTTESDSASEEEMATKETNENKDGQPELKAQIVQLNAALSENREKVKSHDLLVAVLAELNDGNEPSIPVVALRNLINEMRDLRAENAELLDATIKQSVAEKVKVEWVRSIIEGKIRDKHPSGKVEVEMALDNILKDPDVTTMLKHAVEEEMGPKLENPVNEDGTGANDNDDVFILMPGV